MTPMIHRHGEDTILLFLWLTMCHTFKSRFFKSRFKLHILNDILFRHYIISIQFLVGTINVINKICLKALKFHTFKISIPKRTPLNSQSSIKKREIDLRGLLTTLVMALQFDFVFCRLSPIFRLLLQAFLFYLWFFLLRHGLPSTGI